jgi:hypothetical protein
MQMISLRIIPFVDSQSLTLSNAREALFRDDSGGFLLYLCDGEFSRAAEERVIVLGVREALIWLNEPPQDQGSFWE